jgi:Trk K+ transport system NAD-binding subunit
MLTGELVSILIRGMQRAGKVAVKPPWGHFERHVVILGLNGHLDGLIHQIHGALGGLHHIVIVHPEAAQLPVTDRPAYRNVFAVAGDPTSSRTLEEADLDQAARVVVLASIGDGPAGASPDNRALMATVAVLCRHRPIPMVVELSDQETLRYTRGLPEVDVVTGLGYAGCMLAQAVLNPGVTEVYDHLLRFTGESNELYSVPVPERLVGRSFSEAQLELSDDDREAVIVLGIDRSPEGRPRSRFTLCPAAPESGLEPADLLLERGDRLVVMAYCRPSTPEVEPADPWSPTWLVRR